MPSRLHSQLQLRLHILLLLLLAAAPAAEHQLLASAEEAQPITLEGCPDKCGEMSIPFPFGMTPGCFRPGFQIVCNHSFSPPRAFIAADIAAHDTTYQTNYSYTVMANGSLDLHAPTYQLVELVDVSVATSEARVRAAVNSLCNVSRLSVAHFSGKLEATHLGNNSDPFRISLTRNIVVGVGTSVEPFMGTQTITSAIEQAPVAMAFEPTCVSYMAREDLKLAANRSCSGLGCCTAKLPPTAPPLTAFVVKLKLEPMTWTWEETPCSYGMLVESSWYNFSTSDLYGYEGLSGRFHRGVPVVLDFAIRNKIGSSASCPADGRKPPADYACVSGNSFCSDLDNASRDGYVCKCWDNYDGNPYIVNGCQDIDECEMPDTYPCFGICKNTLGGYDCRCKFGMKGDAKENNCSDIFPLAAKVVLGIAAFIVVCVIMVMSLQHLKIKRFYEQNGGPALKGVKNIRIYRRKQVKQITNNYKHVIGEGQFGKVYMGTMEDEQQVAIKIAIKIDNDMKKEFTDEVIIQSEMRHKNIVRLLGCCLEVDVPMLMYEYVARGSLYDVLFGARRVDIISVDTRLGIAVGSAEGLAYMHSAVESTIRHGDVKSANILLDQNFTPKVSDFGTTRLLARGKAEMTDHVTGDLGYIDPVYMEEGVVTQKSDVYSFGVILIELITRRPAVYDKHRNYVANFVQASLDKEVRSFVDTTITSETDIKLVEMASEVAVQCLRPNIEERPDMKQVEQRLNHIIGQSAQYGQRANYQADHS